MASSRTTTHRLAQTLDDSVQPLFVIDEDRQIVFWNRACVDWTGVSAEAMLGQTCVYQAPDASVEPAAALAAALCPPPEAFSGIRQRTLREATLSAGRKLSRWIEYLPLRDGADGAASVLALVASDDAQCSEPDEATSHSLGSGTGGPLAEQEATNEELHRQLAEFRAAAQRRYVPENLIGNHPVIVRARAQATLAAGGREPVLIVGPPGVGKEHLARAIHYRGLVDRPDAAVAKLIPLACSAVGADLLWSTLAALGDKRAATNSADTLLLNDIDQMPVETQRPLADLLASGGLAQRVISTSTRRLESLVAEPAFDPRLACALTTLMIELPPLAARLDDLPLLAQALVEETNATTDKQLAGFAPETLDLLASHDWPGNIDELRKLVIAAHKQSEPPHIKARDVAQRLRLAQEAAARPSRAPEPIDLEKFLADVERELITRALARSKGNKSRAARLLGLTRPRLYRRMVQLGLEEPPGPPETPIFEPI